MSLSLPTSRTSHESTLISLLLRCTVSSVRQSDSFDPYRRNMVTVFRKTFNPPNSKDSPVQNDQNGDTRKPSWRWRRMKVCRPPFPISLVKNFSCTQTNVSSRAEGLFTKWIQSTDTTLATFASSLPSTPAPSFFERNLQVWRQLWRVSEASQILLVLVDVRFPLIHYPPSLEEYVKTLRPKKEVIIVLTKTDLVPKWLAEAWRDWFVEREGPEGASVVIMESYKETEKTSATQGGLTLFSRAD